VYLLEGCFESHENGTLFNRLNAQQIEEYFDRAEERKRALLSGWGELDERVVKYAERITGMKITSIPFILEPNGKK
jgi:hypothetical protein